ncbi:unnamed protein product [Effrenium voratum]|nr:unnamed protein product [Effrenium voratum]
MLIRPFYLHEYVRAAGLLHRLIYLDTDTVIMGDLGELQDIDLEGHPCAAVKYCLQSLDVYVDFDALRELGYTNYNPKACIANRGLLVIDVQRWGQLKLTAEIEAWLSRYSSSKRDLWRAGVSQPPWLLAMKEDFLDLGDEWNCNSLGRTRMPYVEGLFLRENGFDHAAVRKLGAHFDKNGEVEPYIVLCSDKGKLLHYNGAAKPWNWQTYYPDTKLPMCVIPEKMQPQLFTSSTEVKLFCKPVNFVSCIDIWTSFISEDTACALRDTEQEWPEEAEWLVNMGEVAAKAEEDRKIREKERLLKKEQQKDEVKAREESQAKMLKVEELAAAAQKREREAAKEREILEAERIG